MANATIDTDGHLLVAAEVAGITKVLLMPEVEGKRLVFFDVLMKSNSTLRVSREALVADVDAAIVEVELWREQVGDAVIEWNNEKIPVKPRLS